MENFQDLKITYKDYCLSLTFTLLLSLFLLTLYPTFLYKSCRLPMPKAHSQPVIVAPQGESHIRRSTLATDEIVSRPAADVNTLYDVLQSSVKRFGDKEALGFRNIVDIIEEEKEVVKVVNGQEQRELKKWKYFQLSEFQYVGYRKMSEICHDIGAGMAHLGLKKGNKLEIFAATR
jgi:long-chain acyl-CoA synthetase